MDQIQIGKFIAELRKEKGLTQMALGEKLGVTNKTVSRWENGNYMPDISMMPSLCSELGISINELITGSRLDGDAFKQHADDNLVESYHHIKRLKHDKSIISFFTGTGTGLVISCLYSPYSTRRTVAILIGIVMILIGWYRQSNYDKYVLAQIEKEKLKSPS